MPDALTIPAALVRPVAEAAYELLGRATRSILRRMESPDRAESRGCFVNSTPCAACWKRWGPIDADRPGACDGSPSGVR